MIIANGTIEAKVKTAGGIDPVTGFPVPSTGLASQQAQEGAANPPAWGDPIPCQWHEVTHDNLGRTVSGNFILASYSVLIEQGASPFTAEQVRLKDAAGNTVSDRLSVISSEPLDAVCETRILLK